MYELERISEIIFPFPIPPTCLLTWMHISRYASNFLVLLRCMTAFQKSGAGHACGTLRPLRRARWNYPDISHVCWDFDSELLCIIDPTIPCIISFPYENARKAQVAYSHIHVDLLSILHWTWFRPLLPVTHSISLPPFPIFCLYDRSVFLNVLKSSRTGYCPVTWIYTL